MNLKYLGKNEISDRILDYLEKQGDRGASSMELREVAKFDCIAPYMNLISEFLDLKVLPHCFWFFLKEEHRQCTNQISDRMLTGNEAV